MRQPPSDSKDLPNANDPLSEPTVNRRVWAAYLSRGYSRAEFARRVGANYNAVQAWDFGKHDMALSTFLRACEVLGYSADELGFGKTTKRRELIALNLSPEADGLTFANVYGRPGRAFPANREKLEGPELLHFVNGLGASKEAQEALAAAYQSSRGCYYSRSPTWVEHFVLAFEHSKKLSPGARIAKAITAADHADAVKEATALDGHPPLPPPDPPPPPARTRKSR